MTAGLLPEIACYGLAGHTSSPRDLVARACAAMRDHDTLARAASSSGQELQ